LIASASTLLLLLPYYKISTKDFDRKLWWDMVKYALPLVVVSFAGVINEMLDRQLLKYILPYSNEENRAQLGIYGANYKLAMLISLFTQAFRYAAEPFFFSHAKEKNAPKLYAAIAKYFTIANLLGFLMIVLYLHYFKYYVGKDGSRFHEGLKVVPILLMANIFLGLYYNISTWFKVTDNTTYGMYIALGGAAITIILNIWWIPIFGYVGSAWATLICYGSMTFMSYYIGRKHYPMQYDWLGIFAYMSFAVAVFFVHRTCVNYFHFNHTMASISAAVLFITYAFTIFKLEYKTYKESGIFE
jgi:O-antigen/teichoic acid export membrane protein